MLLVVPLGEIAPRVREGVAVIIDRLELEPSFPATQRLADRATHAARSLPGQLDLRLLEEAQARFRRPSWLARTGLWFILLWFPFLQPVLAGGLEMFADPGAWNVTHGLYRIVSALSAVHLLTGFAVVATIFVALLACMYARGLRLVRKFRADQDDASPLTRAVDDLIVGEVLVPLVSPLGERSERLAHLSLLLDDGEAAP